MMVSFHLGMGACRNARVIELTQPARSMGAKWVEAGSTASWPCGGGRACGKRETDGCDERFHAAARFSAAMANFLICIKACITLPAFRPPISSRRMVGTICQD